MRTLALAPLFICLTALAAPPNPADYPSRYQVITGSKIASLMLGDFCTMSLRDSGNPSLALVVQRRRYCHTWDANTTFQGRREKNNLKLLVQDDKGKMKVEDWPIVSTVAITPPPK